MSETYSVVFDENANLIRVGGELTFSTVTEILAQAQTMFETMTMLNIDFTDVTRSDSAGLALLIDWMRTAKKVSKSITFYNIPQQILAIANASGLDDLLPLSDRK